MLINELTPPKGTVHATVYEEFPTLSNLFLPAKMITGQVGPQCVVFGMKEKEWTEH